MLGKSHRKGMADASKVYGDKFEKVGDDLKRFEKEHIKKHEEENERQKDINDHFEKKIDNLEKGRIYKDNTLYDIKEVLNESEQEYLMAYLVTLANELDANEEQQEFIRALYRQSISRAFRILRASERVLRCCHQKGLSRGARG